MRELFDTGLVDVLPVSRAALAPLSAPNDASLLYGSAPNVYAPTVQGLKLLRETGVIGEELLKQPAPTYGPRNSLFLAHELAVRDVRVWLEASAQAGGHEVECWRDGEAAAIDLGRSQAPFSVRPDAWFVYRMGGMVLVGLVEVDRGTERGDRRWHEKLDAYTALFSEGQLLGATGYQNARVLVLTRSMNSLIRLEELIFSYGGKHAPRFWLTASSTLFETDLALPVWRQVGTQTLCPLMPTLL